MAAPTPLPLKPVTPKEFHYINGLTIHTTRRMCKFEFGEDKVFKIVKNNKEKTFDIFLMEGVDEDKVKQFRRFWGKNLRVFVINPTQVEDSKNE